MASSREGGTCDGTGIFHHTQKNGDEVSAGSIGSA
jgi:hypothetical protein